MITPEPLFFIYLCIFRKFNKIFAQKVFRTCEGRKCQVIQRTGCKRGTGSWMGEKWLGRKAQKGFFLNAEWPLTYSEESNHNVQSIKCFHNFLFLQLGSWFSHTSATLTVLSHTWMLMGWRRKRGGLSQLISSGYLFPLQHPDFSLWI